MKTKVLTLVFLLNVLPALGQTSIHTDAESQSATLQNISIAHNWRLTEMPGRIETRSLALAPNGDLWVGSIDGAAHYNGSRWEKHTFNGGMDQGPIKTIKALPNGDVLGITPVGLFRLREGNWTILSPDIKARFHPTGAIHPATNGDTWIGHDTGLAFLDRNERIQLLNTGSNVQSVLVDSENSLWWIQGDRNTVYRCPAALESVRNPDRWEQISPPSHLASSISSLLETKDGNIWFSSINLETPLKYYDRKSNAWAPVDLSQTTGSHLSFDIAKDSQERIWTASSGRLVVTDGDGISSIEFPEVPMPHRRTLMAVSSEDIMWISELGAHPYRIDLSGYPWRRYDGLNFQCEGHGRFWFLDESGQALSSPQNQPRISPSPVFSDTLIEQPVRIAPTRSGELVAYGGHRGDAALSLFDGESWALHAFPEFATGFDLESFLEREDGSFVLGSGQSSVDLPKLRGGLLFLRKTSNGFTPEYLPAENHIAHRIIGLAETKDGDLYTGGNRFIRIRNGVTSNEHLATGRPGSRLGDLLTDLDGNLWASSYARGVFRLSNGEYEWFYPDNSGLADPNVLDLALMPGGDLLALTSESVFRFDGQDWYEIIELPLAFPLQHEAGELRVSSDGSIWINLAHLFWRYQWLQNNGYNETMSPRFSTLRYQIENIPPTTSIIPIATSDPRALKARFQAWDAGGSSRQSEIQFSYRLDEGAWSRFSLINEISLLQVAEGKHVLEVRSRDRDFNIDPKTARYVFAISIPFWREAWFYQLLVILSLALVALYVFVTKYRAKHQVALEHQKLAFFTNLSHEIRTPLSLVIAPLEQAIKERTDGKLKRYLEQASHSASELARIVDQLLDLRRAQSGFMKIRAESTELVSYTNSISASFAFAASTRQQTVIFESELSQLACLVDREKLQSILNNLVLNSLRYSPNGSVVHIGLSLEDGDPPFAVFAVEDEGCGIKADFVKKALLPFARSDDKPISSVKGTGIGLAFVAEIISVWGGSIDIESPLAKDVENPGTRITFRIPVKHLDESESRDASTETTEFPSLEVSSNQNSDTGLPILLFVEDDPDMGAFLKTELEGAYYVDWQRNGQEGFRAAKKTVPDIILTDRMMPQMDGFELCRAIRKERATDHIPIVMLTAASSKESEVEGLKAGANDFLAKPYSIDTLKQRLSNQLGIRDQLRAKLKAEFSRIGAQDTEPKIVDPFLAQVTDLVERHMTDFNFNSAELGKLVFMSRSTLYRKMNAFAGVSPSHFIRQLRMKKAGKLIEQTSLTVAEAMESVGIIDYRTFSKWFKETYGCTPTEHRERNTAK